MSGTHRKIRSHSQRIATVGVATATVSALTISAAPPPPPKPAPEPVVRNVDLMAAINKWPSPGQIPDLTGGLGTVGYNFAQTFADGLIRAIVNNVNLAALGAAVGVDPDA